MNPLFWPKGAGGKEMAGLAVVQALTHSHSPETLSGGKAGSSQLHGFLPRVLGVTELGVAQDAEEREGEEVQEAANGGEYPVFSLWHS